MNLRHKKPINSYRGQTNNDKNEFNDDDFKHLPSPAKKFNNSNGEQIYKYSKILAKFIMSSNQFYHQMQKSPKKQKSQIGLILEEAKTIREESKNQQLQKKMQQPKQKVKIILEIQNENLQCEQHKQKQYYKIEQSQSNLQVEEVSELKFQKPTAKTLAIKSPSINTEVPKQRPQFLATQKVQNIAPQTYVNMYSQNIPMGGFPNQAMYGNMPMSQYMGYYQQMMRVAMLQQMIKNEQMKGMNFNNFNPQFMAELMANPGLMGLKQNMYPTMNYIGNIPQTVPPPILKNNPPIHDLTSAFLRKKQSIFNYSKQRPNQIAKRASFHVAIAYHIYMNELEKSGANTSDVEHIDPTRQSRQIKQREQVSKKNTRTKGPK